MVNFQLLLLFLINLVNVNFSFLKRNTNQQMSSYILCELLLNTNEKLDLVIYDCVTFLDSYRFLTSGLDNFTSKLNEEVFKITKKW